MNGKIERVDNRVIVSGDLYDFHRLLAALHAIVEKAGYTDVVLDLGACTAAFQNDLPDFFRPGVTGEWR